MTAVWRILVGEPVDEHHLRMTSQDSLNIDHMAPTDFQRGNHFVPDDQPLDFRRTLRLDGADDHVLATLTAAYSFGEHLRRLAHTRGIAEKNLEPPPFLAPLFLFDLFEQPLRIAPKL